MATKIVRIRRVPKEIIPAGYLTIRETVKYLKKYLKINLSYHGLSYYRKLKIIDKPVRFKGHMDKFYQAHPLQIKILTAKLLTAFLNIKLEDLYKYTTRLSPEIYLQLPSIIVKTYEDVWGFKYNMPSLRYRGAGALYGTLYVGMRKVLDNVLEKVELKKSVEDFSRLLDEETFRYKKAMEQSPAYKMLSLGE